MTPGEPLFERERCKQLLQDRGRKPELIDEDLDLIESAPVPPMMMQAASGSGKPLELWMWDQIGPAQAFVQRAFERSNDFTEFAVELALQGQAQNAKHLYKAMQQLNG